MASIQVSRLPRGPSAPVAHRGQAESLPAFGLLNAPRVTHYLHFSQISKFAPHLLSSFAGEMFTEFTCKLQQIHATVSSGQFALHISEDGTVTLFPTPLLSSELRPKNASLVR
jgi:hypothetical protein